MNNLQATELEVEWARQKRGAVVAHAFTPGGRTSFCGGEKRVSEKNWAVLHKERGTVCFQCAARLKGFTLEWTRVA